MKYMILIHSNPAFVKEFEGLSEEELRGLGEGHFALADDLAESGELIVAEGLDGPDRAVHVRVQDGRTLTSDGPYAEAKEHLAGFYLVDCASVERAVEIAARVPDATWGHVEVRPVLDMRAFDL